VWDVQFADEDHGWCNTREQEIALTIDGGLTWERITGLGSDFDDLSFGSATVGVAVGPTGNVFGSTDGGRTWAQQHAGWAGWSHPRAVWTSWATDGVLVGTETKIQYTRSGGQLP